MIKLFFNFNFKQNLEKYENTLITEKDINVDQNLIEEDVDYEDN